MTDTIKLIDSIRKVYNEKGFSINKLDSLLQEKGKNVSKSTIARFFSDKNKDDYNYRYNDTIRPFAEVLLDVDTFEQTDDTETRAMKSFVQVKRNKIEELEESLAKEKKKRHDTIEKYETEILKIREQHELDTKIIREQLVFKDKRLDQFIDAMFTKDKKIDELTEQIRQLTQKLLDCENCRKAKK